MTKNDIAGALCARIRNMSKSMALHAVDGFAAILSDAFASGQSVYLRGFGTLEVRPTKERKARNITAGTSVVVPAGRKVKFKPCKKLKNRMNNGTI